jgi:hypothetical protein
VLKAQFGGSDSVKMHFIDLVLPVFATLLFRLSPFLRFKATGG